MNTRTITKFLPLLTLLILLVLLGAEDLFAQCPMCKAAAESNLKNGGSHAKGLNTGILYLFFTPYLIVGVLGFIWWQKNGKAKAEEDRMLEAEG